MSIEITNFVNVEKKAQSLGCNIPTDIAILPRNFEEAKAKTDLLHESSTATVRVLFRNNDISETPLEMDGEKFPQISEKSFVEWIGPTIFVGFALWSQHPLALSLALGVISNYITDLFKGMPSGGQVKLDFVIETKRKNCIRLKYKGSESGFDKLPEVIREVANSDK